MGAVSVAIHDVELTLPRWRMPGRRAATATCGFDEDVVTLAVEAALPLLDRLKRSAPRPHALLLATVSSPMVEGGSAQTVAEALDLQGDLLSVELGGTTTAGATALRMAAGLLEHDDRPVLVIATDRRRTAPDRPMGDGAIACLVHRDTRDDRAVATVTFDGSSTHLVRDRWQLAGAPGGTEADRSLRAAQRADPVDVDLVVDVDGPSIPRVGTLGTPAALLHALLAAGADPDHRAAVLVTAGGVAHRLQVTGAGGLDAAVRRLRRHIDAGDEAAPPVAGEVEGFAPYASQPRSWREVGQDLRLEGQRDPASGEILFPAVPAASATGLQPHLLARTGRVLAQTRDHVYPAGGPITMAVVELDDGGRIYCQGTDGAQLTIDDRVELTLRRLHDGGGVPQYFLKARPAQDASARE